MQIQKKSHFQICLSKEFTFSDCCQRMQIDFGKDCTLLDVLFKKWTWGTCFPILRVLCESSMLEGSCGFIIFRALYDFSILRWICDLSILRWIRLRPDILGYVGFWARWGSMCLQFFFMVMFFNVLETMHGFSILFGICDFQS